jgi:hypothetical protein
MTRPEIIRALCMNKINEIYDDAGINDTYELYLMLEQGCIGYNNMSDEELQAEYWEIFNESAVV